MRRHTLALAAALVLTTAGAAATAQTPATGATRPVTISPEQLHRQVDVRSLPLTIIEEPY
jgi:hypothetical protein